MKLAIISDSHDNIPNTEKFLSWAKSNNIGMIIHCGDLAAPAMLKKVVAPAFSGPIHLIHGNVSDRELLKKVCSEISNVTLHGDEGEVEVEGLKIAFCYFPEKAKELAESKKYDLVFYGHTHKPWIEKIGSVVLANPGTLSGMFSKATFAVFNTEDKNLELKILENI
ncbi:MAG: YfcE family phosphodiesterase [Candidatus Buchananbacteria bacterium]|nr:YfcE family phosphodiesterase [Candidatus Buchananbacteria bacterium]